MESLDALVSLGKSQLENGHFDEALSSFEQAILLEQNDPDLWNYKGVTLRSLGRYDEAIECFNKSLSLDPRDKNSSKSKITIILELQHQNNIRQKLK